MIFACQDLCGKFSVTQEDLRDLSTPNARKMDLFWRGKMVTLCKILFPDEDCESFYNSENVGIAEKFEYMMKGIDEQYNEVKQRLSSDNTSGYSKTLLGYIGNVLKNVNKAIETDVIRCFISHTWAKGQHSFAKYLCNRLSRFKNIEVWLDENQILPGDHNYERLSLAIEKNTNLTICILSPEYLASGNCKVELSKAAELYRAKDHKLIPILLAKCDIPLEIQGLAWADFIYAINSKNEINIKQFNHALKPLVQAIRGVKRELLPVK